jgi:hypothetical protein
MRTIHKHILQITDTQYVMLPEGSAILSVGEQRNALCVWYICDTDNPLNEQHWFSVYGTGNPVPGRLRDLGTFLGTVLTHDQQLVWHIFHNGSKLVA